jgi:hypothetical protein
MRTSSFWPLAETKTGSHPLRKKEFSFRYVNLDRFTLCQVNKWLIPVRAVVHGYGRVGWQGNAADVVRIKMARHMGKIR